MDQIADGIPATRQIGSGGCPDRAVSGRRRVKALVRVAHRNNELPAACTRSRRCDRMKYDESEETDGVEEIENVRAKERSLGSLWTASNRAVVRRQIAASLCLFSSLSPTIFPEREVRSSSRPSNVWIALYRVKMCAWLRCLFIFV